MKKTLLIFLVFIGCATTRISSVKAPYHSSFNRILVYGNYDDIGRRTSYETEIVDALRDHGIHAWRSVDLFPPLKDYDSADYAAMRQKIGYQAILALTPNGTSTTRRTDVYDNWYGGVSADSYDDLSGIYTVASLYIAGSKERIYKASLSTSLGKYTQVETARYNMAQNLIDDLADNGFLISKEK